jgi:hypothetical protein
MVSIAKRGTLPRHLIGDKTDRGDGDLGNTQEGA